MSQSLRQCALSASVGLALAAAMAAHAGAETLADAIADAYQTNPNLASQRASLRALDENYVQARAGWRPTLSAIAQAQWADTRLSAVAANSGFGASPQHTRSRVGAYQLSFQQPIWNGGRTAAAVTAANGDVLQGREQLRQVEAQVMQAVMTAYADVLRDQENVAAQRQYEGLLEDQLKEEQTRFDVGDVTRTDVAQSQSRLAAAQTQLASAQAQLAADRANYASLVGHNPGTLAPLPSLDYLMPGNVDDAFTIAERNSPQIRAQEYAEQASRARIDEARAGRMPQLTFNATAANTGPVFPYLGKDIQSEGTATFQLSIPLFTGGSVSSQIRQSIERNNADRITVETQRRSVLQTITQNWNLLLAARGNIAATEEQVKAATVAYQGMHEEEQAGLRSTLDVLIAAQDLSGAQVNLATARHDEFVSSTNVLAVMGRLDARDLIPSQPRYDPAANFRRLRITWGWVPWEEPISVIDRYLTAPPESHLHSLPQEPAIGPGLDPKPQTTSARPPR